MKSYIKRFHNFSELSRAEKIATMREYLEKASEDGGYEGITLQHLADHFEDGKYSEITGKIRALSGNLRSAENYKEQLKIQVAKISNYRTGWKKCGKIGELQGKIKTMRSKTEKLQEKRKRLKGEFNRLLQRFFYLQSKGEIEKVITGKEIRGGKTVYSLQ